MTGFRKYVCAAAAGFFAAAGAFSAPPVLSADYAALYPERGALAPVEGVWQLTADGGALLAISACAGRPGTYDVTVVDSPDFTVMPGTPVGRLAATARTGSYDLTLTSRAGLPADYKDRLGRRRDFVLELSPDTDGRFTLSAYHRGKRISLRRWLPYLFRVSVVENATRPEGIDGAVRVWPPAVPLEPVVL